MRRRLWPLAAVLVLALCGLASAAEQRPAIRRAQPPALSTAYVAQLRVVSAQVDASLREISALPAVTAANKPTVVAAGTRLAAAAAATRDMLRTYRGASTRYGTPEEWQLSQKLLTDLQTARTTYGQRAGVTLPAPTAKQRSAAQELFETTLAVVANQQIVRWTGDEALAEALTSGSLATVNDRLRQELVRRMRTQAEQAVSNATGLSLALNVPLKQQVRFQLERLAVNWLARTVLNVSPQGLVIQLAGAPIVNLIGAKLEAALRNTADPAGRAESTTRQFSKRRSQMLLLPPTSSLRDARAFAAKVERELNRTGFLKLDLRRARNTEVLATLERAEVLTRTALARFRSRFLLDSPMARADLNAMVDQAKRLLHDIQEITRRLGSTSAGGGKGSILGDWEAGGGVMRVTGGGTSFVGKLVKTYTFCRSGSVPTGQVEWALTQTAPNKFTGTVRYYRVSNCTYIGDATNARWEYRPADDTLYSCSYSPDPSLPGGGCATSKRVK